MMMYVGTVVRAAPVRDGGHLLAIDWKRKKIVQRLPIFPENPSLDHDPNPRGNTRGCRGVRVVGDRIVATDYHTVRVLDRDLRQQRSFSHGCMVGLHETAVHGNRLWVTATTIDAALAFDLESGRLVEQLWPREWLDVQRALDVEPIDLDKTADQRQQFLSNDHIDHPSHLHLNAVALDGDTVYVTAVRKKAIINAATKRVVVLHDFMRGAHNMEIHRPGQVWVSDTQRRALRRYDLVSGELLQSIDLTANRFVRSILRREAVKFRVYRAAVRLGLTDGYRGRPIYVRGLRVVGDRAYVGISPAAILEVDLNEGRVIDAMEISRDVNVCVHGLDVAVD